MLQKWQLLSWYNHGVLLTLLQLRHHCGAALGQMQDCFQLRSLHFLRSCMFCSYVCCQLHGRFSRDSPPAVLEPFVSQCLVIWFEFAVAACACRCICVRHGCASVSNLTAACLVFGLTLNSNTYSRMACKFIKLACCSAFVLSFYLTKYGHVTCLQRSSYGSYHMHACELVLNVGTLYH